MNIRPLCVSASIATLLAAPPAFADFDAALSDYKAGHLLAAD